MNEKIKYREVCAKMKITEKMNFDYEMLKKEGPITIVAFGDSVTHGAVGANEFNYETVYWNRLKNKINAVNPYVPVNVINAGIAGITAKGSLERMDRQVLSHNPDLVIVCFGLNDVNGTLSEYTDSLETIFRKCKDFGCDVIFMTPNMLNTSVSEKTEQKYMEYASVAAGYQNGGKMDLYISSAIKKAQQMDVAVCDCYAQWKKLSETEDITQRLANYINHPTKEMHELFASMLFDLIFADSKKTEK